MAMGILHHRANRVAPLDQVSYFLDYNPNPNARVPIPDPMTRALTGQADFHTMWQRPRRRRVAGGSVNGSGGLDEMQSDRRDAGQRGCQPLAFDDGMTFGTVDISRPTWCAGCRPATAPAADGLDAGRGLFLCGLPGRGHLHRPRRHGPRLWASSSGAWDGRGRGGPV